MSDQTPQQPGWGPPPGSPPPPGWGPPPAPRKQRSGAFKAGFLGCFGVLAAVIVVIIVVAVIASSGSKDTTATPNVSESGSVATTPATEAPTTATPKPRQWRTVLRVSGSSDKRTDVFTLHGGKTRLTYKFTDTSGFGTIVGAIYVLDEGDSLAKSGGIPEVTVSEPGSDSTFLVKDAGRYYLDISAANARWTVTIQELR